MAEVGDSEVDGPEAGGELVRVGEEQVVEARPLPVAGGAESAQAIATRKVSLPATVAAASGGFVLGVAAFMLARVVRRPGAARSVSRRRRRMLAKQRGVDIAASRSFLVDVHLLKR
ncbi:MAG TPA: hypothetical protein VHF88_06700 [Thermoleophilaceae bacterium]|nr:hypothetical protein [Thermoleophilaceae bacterium]